MIRYKPFWRHGARRPRGRGGESHSTTRTANTRCERPLNANSNGNSAGIARRTHVPRNANPARQIRPRDEQQPESEHLGFLRLTAREKSGTNSNKPNN